MPKKGRGLGQFADLRGRELGEKEVVVFLREREGEGVDTLMHPI